MDTIAMTMTAPARRRRISEKPRPRHYQPRLEELESRLVPSNLLTYHNDNSSTGQNLAVVKLTPANVNSTSFGKLFTTYVDGQVYAQPLVMTNVNITTGPQPGIHNVAIVCTEHDDVYAIDSGTGAIQWHDSFINPAAGITPVPSVDVGVNDLSPEIGITSTPVIDPNTNTLYLTAKTKEIKGSDSHYIYRLHALNIADGTEKFGGPVVIADTIWNGGNTFTFVSGPSVNGTGDGSVNGVVTFNALRQLQRPGLTLANGNVYMAFGSHGDVTPYHGWVLGYNTQNLQLAAVFNATPNGSDGGIWQGGGKIDVDATGHLFFSTGNGTFDTTLTAAGFPSLGDYSDSVIKLAVDPTSSATNPNINGWGLKVVDYFTPFNQQDLSNSDHDLDSGGPLLLPNAAGSTAHPHLLVTAGKEGTIYLIDRDNMGKFDPNSNHVVQQLVSAINGTFGTPAYFNGTIYYVSGFGGPAVTFSIAHAMLSATPTSQSSISFGFPGSTPSISANGASNGIVWDLDRNSMQLLAYDATSYGTLRYGSGQAANDRDAIGEVVKFSTPAVVNGMVYVGTANSLVVYGLFPNPTTLPSGPSSLTATAVTSSQINLQWVDHGSNESGYAVEESTDGIHFAQIGSATVHSTMFAVGGLQPETTYAFRVRAFNSAGDSPFTRTVTATTPANPGANGLDFSQGFAGSDSLLSFSGPPPAISGSALQLTDGGANESATAFSSNRVAVNRFATQFTFQIANTTDPSGDGFTFCIQGVGRFARGPTGGGLGYGPDAPGGSGGIPNSVAVKFDLYSNAGEGFDSTGQYTNGASPTLPGSIDLGGTGIDLHSQDVFQVVMTYNGVILNVTITDTSTGAHATQSYQVNIPSIVGGSTAFVGFTAGTGGLTSVQSILTWTYVPISDTPTAPPSNLQASPISSTQVALSWTANSHNAVAFLIERSSAAAGPFSLVGQTSGATTNFVDTGLNPNSQYFYRVRATNAAGNSAYCQVVGVMTLNARSEVRNATVIGTSITWTGQGAAKSGDSVSARSYAVYRDTDSGDTVRPPYELGVVASYVADTGPASKPTHHHPPASRDLDDLLWSDGDWSWLR
jgi:Legume lectin domain/Fibronectin type III domain